MTLLQMCEWLETTRVAEFVTLSMWGFAGLVAVHLLGLGLSAGTILWMDLRLLGWALVSCPVSSVYRRLTPVLIVGFSMMVVSGVLLFVGYATAAYANLYFRLKLVAMLIAGVNALLYHRFTARTIHAWDTNVRVPAAARATGLISMAVWTVVILAGRMMSYTMF